MPITCMYKCFIFIIRVYNKDSWRLMGGGSANLGQLHSKYKFVTQISNGVISIRYDNILFRVLLLKFFVSPLFIWRQFSQASELYNTKKIYISRSHFYAHFNYNNKNGKNASQLSFVSQFQYASRKKISHFAMEIVFQISFIFRFEFGFG